MSCGSLEIIPFLSLGETPVANALRAKADLANTEVRHPLEVAFCPECALVQTTYGVPREIIFDASYPYFSSYSDELVNHAKLHAEALIDERGLNSKSLVVELASNDGYLLQHFAHAGVPVLGVEPAPIQAKVAKAAGIPTRVEFFGKQSAATLVAEGHSADVIIANNVMAHVPDVNDFVAGISILLGEDGLATIENPYVRDLIENCEFDTIYHEHRCYFSCTSVSNLVERHGLHLNHVEYFPGLHGGTLRWHISRRADQSTEVQKYITAEHECGLDTLAYYEKFADDVKRVRTQLRRMLLGLKSKGARIAAYGAAAKGATLLNYADLGPDVIEYVVDRNEHKQGLYMPGQRIPILDPRILLSDTPDYLLLLAWNFEAEITSQQQLYIAGGGRLIVPVPTPTIRDHQPVDSRVHAN